MKLVSKQQFTSGVALLAWQAVAMLIGFIGQADAVLAMVPDPTWLVAFLTVVIAPPTWLTIIAITVGASMVAWSLLDRIRGT